MPEIQEIPTSRAKRSQPLFARIDSSFDSNRNLWASFLLVLGFLIRIWHASGTFLNSDEVMHFAAANQPTWLQSYKVSLAISHPPLLIFVEHVWRVFGTSELMLRLPLILAGMAFCWVAFGWAEMLFEKSVAWTIFAFVLGSAYFLERALPDNSGAAMLFSGFSLWLAIASPFSASLFAPALAIYA